MLHTNETDTDVEELRERVVALSERIVALAEAANIIAEAVAPFRSLSGREEQTFIIPDGFKAFDKAAARLEAARIAAISEFVEARRLLDGEELCHH